MPPYKKLYASGEDYLETILVLQKKKGMVRSVDVARYMDVSKPSVCHAVAALRDGGFLTMDENYYLVGLSNILDGEFARRKPAKRSHREVVRAAVMDSELLGEVIEGVETVTGVKALLVLAVTSLHFTVVARRVGTDELVADPQLGGCGLKQGRQIPLAVGEAVGELKSIVSLDTFHADTSAGIPLEQLFQEIGGGTGGLLRVGGQEAQAGKLVNSSVLV